MNNRVVKAVYKGILRYCKVRHRCVIGLDLSLIDIQSFQIRSNAAVNGLNFAATEPVCIFAFVSKLRYPNLVAGIG
jgi:hypothetical protein